MIKNLADATSKEFKKWTCGVIFFYRRFDLSEAYDSFVASDPSVKLWLSKQQFRKWLEFYNISINGMTPEIGRNSKGRTLKLNLK